MARRRPQERTVLVNARSGPTVLGLDCSSKTVGWGLVSLENPALIAYGHIKPIKSKDADLKTRLIDIYDRVDELCNEMRPDCVAIEDIKKYMKGRSSAQTITVLAGFNRVITVAAAKHASDFEYYSEAQVRKIIKTSLNINRKLVKEDMPDVIREHLESRFSGPLNTKNELAEETFDEADGISTGWAFALDRG